MKNIVPQVNFAGVNTNLVAVCSRCISIFSLCVRQVEVHVHTTCDEKLTFMVVFNDGNYLQRPIILVLNFCLTSKNPPNNQPFLKKKKEKPRAAKAKGDDTSQET